MMDNIAAHLPDDVPDLTNPEAVGKYIREKHQELLRSVEHPPGNREAFKDNVLKTDLFNRMCLALITSMKTEDSESPDDLDELIEYYDCEHSDASHDMFGLREVLRIENARLVQLEKLGQTLTSDAAVTAIKDVNDKSHALPVQPPINAQFLLYLFLEKNGREEAVGDALETYSQHVERLGKFRADILFYREVALSALPFIKRVVAKAGGLLLLGEWIRRNIS